MSVTVHAPNGELVIALAGHEELLRKSAAILEDMPSRVGVRLSDRTRAELSTCHPELVFLALLVMRRYDITVVQGARGSGAQVSAKSQGASNATFGESAHNFLPSLALDFVPADGYPPYDYREVERYGMRAAAFVVAGDVIGFPVISGYDWSGDGFKTMAASIDAGRHVLWDKGHIEMHGWREFARTNRLTAI